ncbi:MAG: ATP-binding protein [Candidatus Cloacimonetes bacterium]|nr:ATP-binding protein [Candidatus Cloacimonadota bacterium]
MVYKNFKFNCIIRIILITLTLMLLSYIIFFLNYSITPVLIGLLAILQLLSLLHYIDKTNRYLTNFLESIRYSDFSRSFKIEGLGSAYDKLVSAFNKVIEDFQKIRSEKETNYYYLLNVIQHIGISLIAFQQDGKVELINNSAKRLFRISNLKNINDLKSFSTLLVEKLRNMKSGEKSLIKVQDEDDFLQLMIYVKEFKLKGVSIKLVSIQNIQTELEEQELEAWQKLIRVLTHEIMNSITPISSLAVTINNLLDEIDTTDNAPQEIDDEIIIDIQNALRTINKRSIGLIEFVGTYRNLTHIPKPDFSIFPISQLFKNIQVLMEDELTKKGIDFKISLNPENLEITADEKLIEQIIINLMNNSLQALMNIKNPVLILRSFMNPQNRIMIQVVDNGCGILEDVIDKIFIPFFTTKQNGSGIGLSLSRQIMRLHGGTISVTSVPERETCFTLRF